MKTMVVLLMSTLMFAGTINAQPYGKGNKNFCCVANLTEDQQSQLDKLRLEHRKEVLNLRNQLREKNARMNTLETADKIDMAAINKVIDEISDLKKQMMKKKAEHRQEVRKVLTEEQRVEFDTKRPRSQKMGNMHRGNMKHMNMRQNCRMNNKD